MNAAVLGAQSPFEGMSAERAFGVICENLSGDTGSSVGELAAKVALQMVGTPYLAGMLEIVPERLIVRYDVSDCMILVETCVATALALKGVRLSVDGPQQAEPSWPVVLDNVRMLRYEGGEVDYFKREHYFSGWLQNAADLGVLEEYSDESGVTLDQDFSYMSTHDPARAARLRPMEQRLSGRKYWWIPASRAASAEKSMKTGDIVCFVTGIKGLDVTHVAFVYDKDGRKCFIHASSAAGKVVVDKRTVSQYAKYGVRLARICLPEAK